MEEEDRLKITRNIGRLAELTNIDNLIPKLLEKNVFSSTMIEKYLPSAGLNAVQRNTALYLDIQRRGPTAFKKLMASLVESGHYEAAKLLQADLDIELNRKENNTYDALPEGNCSSGSTLSNFPSYFSNHLENRIVELSHAHPNAVINFNIEPLHVEVKQATRRMDLHPPKPNLSVYPMGSQPKGYFLLINNITFLNNVEDERKGAEVDERNLKILFHELGYEVISYRNLRASEMKSKIQEFTEMEGHKHVHSCVVAILSHGKAGIESGSTDIVASDGIRIADMWILEQFNNYHCPNLMGRPKFFIFQMCRGNNEDFGVQPSRAMSNKRVATDGYPRTQLQSYSDMLIAYSTIPGFVSNRDLYTGTWFIEAICKVFMEHAHDTEISDMLTMVNNNMKRLITENNTMQTSSFVNTGFQKFYFNPGLYDNSETFDSDQVLENGI